MRNNIPKGWIMKRFGEVFEFLSTLSLSRSELTYEKTNDEIYNIHYGDIHSKFVFQILDLTKEKELPKIINNKGNNYTFLKEGDLIIADASEDYAGVASCIELKNVNNKKITAGLHTFAARDNSNLTVNGFRAYILKNDWVFNEVKKLATGSKVYGVSKTNIQNLKILLPPLHEQEKIAEILSKWDELIASQSQLITAKQKQKKALMQKLLSGKLRFPGFTDKWEEKTLGRVVSYFGGGAFKSEDSVDEGVKWLKISNVSIGKLNWNEKSFLPKSFCNNYNDYYLKTGDIVMALTRPILNNELKIARINNVSDESILNQRVAKLIPHNGFSDLYLFHLHQSEIIINEIKSIIAGTDPPNIGIKEMTNIKIFIPKDKKEQQKIASVLTACDEEIETLKTELQSLQNQKKGLMQQLLTGKIRVNG